MLPHASSHAASRPGQLAEAPRPALSAELDGSQWLNRAATVPAGLHANTSARARGHTNGRLD